MRRLIHIFFVGLLLFLLYFRWQVSQGRFFDVDEFSYMHWTAAVARGDKPFIDFFMMITPGFMWVFTPIFWIYGVSTQVFTAGRTLSFFIFLSILGCLSYLWGTTRNWKWALLPAIILAFLPMPYDKFLELRPDNLATLLAFVGVISQIIAMKTGKKNYWILSGLAYSISTFVLAKTVLIVGIGVIIAFFANRKYMLYFFISLALPWVLYFGAAIVSGQFSHVWYAVTKLPFEAYESVKNYPMEAHLFFFPNVAFYGPEKGITKGLIVNHIFWILAAIIGTLRLITPFRDMDKNKALGEILLASIFVVSALGYIKFFPLKHSQYLIPIAFMVAFYAADGLALFFDLIEKKGGRESLIITLIGFMLVLGVVTKEINTPKLLLTNQTQLAQLKTLIQTIPHSARVVDLEGRMLFWQDGYPVSSIPIDSTLTHVTRPPLPLKEYLEQYPADYIWDGDSGRLNLLNRENVDYITSHYTLVAKWGSMLWKRN